MTKHCVVLDQWGPKDQNGRQKSIKHIFREFSQKEDALKQKRRWESQYTGKDIEIEYFSVDDI